MKIENNKTPGLFALVISAAFALSSCASAPSEEESVNEPIYIGQQWPTQPEPMPAEEPMAAEPMPMEATTEQSQLEESSGIMPPVQEEPVMVEVTEPEPVADDIASMPAEHFAVQILASSKFDKLAPFARHYGLDDKLTAEITVNGKTWYVLLLGVYPTLEEAKEAMTSVSERLSTSPWIRTVGSLQNIMNR